MSNKMEELIAEAMRGNTAIKFTGYMNGRKKTFYLTHSDHLFEDLENENEQIFHAGRRLPKSAIEFVKKNCNFLNRELTVECVEGLGYSGGHVSCAGCDTWEPPKTNDSYSINTTVVGNVTGYYPGRVYLREYVAPKSKSLS